jgi:hypothetical protein
MGSILIEVQNKYVKISEKAEMQMKKDNVKTEISFKDSKKKVYSLRPGHGGTNSGNDSSDTNKEINKGEKNHR